MSQVRWHIVTLPRAEGVPEQIVSEPMDDQELRELRAGQIHEVQGISVVVSQIDRDEDGGVAITARRLPGHEEVSGR